MVFTVYRCQISFFACLFLKRKLWRCSLRGGLAALLTTPIQPSPLAALGRDRPHPKVNEKKAANSPPLTFLCEVENFLPSWLVLLRSLHRLKRWAGLWPEGILIRWPGAHSRCCGGHVGGLTIVRGLDALYWAPAFLENDLRPTYKHLTLSSRSGPLAPWSLNLWFCLL